MTVKYTESYINSILDEDKLVFQTIPEMLEHHATVTPNKAAFVFLSTETDRTTVSWQEVFKKSQQFARALVQLGVKPQEVVAICYRTCPEWIFTNFGVIMAGAVPISLSFTYEDGSDAIAMMKLLANCSAIFIDPGFNDGTWNIFKKLIDKFDKNGNLVSSRMPSLRYMASLFAPAKTEDILTFDELLVQSMESTPLPKIHSEDIMGLFQTSGSTGMPKVIAHSHKFYNYLGLSSQHLESGPDEIIYNDRPFSWLGGYPDNMYQGETRVTRSGMCKAPGDTTDYLCNVITQERCSSIVLLPARIEEMMQMEIPADWPIKTLYTGGQPISKRIARCLDKGICKWFGVAYGSSETSLILCNLVNKSKDFKEHSCGKPIPGMELKIVDEKGEIVPVYSRGELYVRTKARFHGYYNDPEKTSAVLTDDGWYKTDDIAFMTEDGTFYIEGRKSDMIISGSMNVAPSILEAVLKNCPGVKDVIVVPIPDETLYQVICACFISQPGSIVSEDDLRKYCENIHADKPRMFTVLPKHYLMFKEFPQSNTGKPLRKMLIPEAERRVKKLA